MLRIKSLERSVDHLPPQLPIARSDASQSRSCCTGSRTVAEQVGLAGERRLSAPSRDQCEDADLT